MSNRDSLEQGNNEKLYQYFLEEERKYKAARIALGLKRARQIKSYGIGFYYDGTLSGYWFFKWCIISSFL